MSRMRPPWLAWWVTTKASPRALARRIATGRRSPLRLSASPVTGSHGCVRRAPRATMSGRCSAAHHSAPASCRRADRVQIRCLIVDDNERFLEAARLLLEREGLAVVGVATTSAEALRLEEQLRPDVVLVDIRLGDESGFELARRLSGTVILISTDAQSEYAEQI